MEYVDKITTNKHGEEIGLTLFEGETVRSSFYMKRETVEQMMKELTDLLAMLDK